MCGVQIGRQQLKDMLVHSELPQGATSRACGLQVGHQELADIIAHSAHGGDAKMACGVQIGRTLDHAEETKAGQ